MCSTSALTLKLRKNKIDISARLILMRSASGNENNKVAGYRSHSRMSLEQTNITKHISEQAEMNR
jgi:hypothetical protein